VHQAVGMLGNIFVPDDAYPYLVIQRGAIDQLRDDPKAWTHRYCDELQSEYYAIAPYLPPNVHAILDIGSGLGGLDILLSRHYDHGVQVTLVDGVDDEPQVKTHRATFNSMAIARAFLRANHVTRVDHIDANDPNRRSKRDYQLAISLRAWCFHVEPAVHLEMVAEAMPTDATLIVDVRRDKPEWEEQLSAEFQPVRVIFPGIKFQTIQYRRK
jgi:SAM-dependent methyltransferase